MTVIDLHMSVICIRSLTQKQKIYWKSFSMQIKIKSKSATKQDLMFLYFRFCNY